MLKFLFSLFLQNEARKTHEEILKTRLKEVEERLQQFELKDQEKAKKFANRLLNG